MALCDGFLIKSDHDYWKNKIYVYSQELTFLEVF